MPTEEEGVKSPLLWEHHLDGLSEKNSVLLTTTKNNVKGLETGCINDVSGSQRCHEFFITASKNFPNLSSQSTYKRKLEQEGLKEL